MHETMEMIRQEAEALEREWAESERSTLAMSGSTEEEQFRADVPLGAESA